MRISIVLFGAPVLDVAIGPSETAAEGSEGGAQYVALGGSFEPVEDGSDLVEPDLPYGFTRTRR